MGLQLGDAGLVLPKNFMESTRIQGVGVHKRAYAKLTFMKRVAEYVKGCPGSIKTIESDVQTTHANMLSNEGGRLTPKPSLESVSVANDGGQDLSDAMIFECSVAVKVYNKNDFDEIDKTFFTPGHRVKVQVGWVGGEFDTLIGDITGFDFSINQDFSYDCTIKIGGMTDGVKGADLIYAKGLDVKGLEYEDEESEKTVIPSDIISGLIGVAARNDSEAKRGKAKEYSGESPLRGNYVNAAPIMDDQGVLNWFGSKESVDFVSLGSLVKFINKNANKGKIFKKGPFEFDIKFGNSSKMDRNLYSADIMTMLIAHSTRALNYGKQANFSAASNPSGNPEDQIYLSIPYLQTEYDAMANGTSNTDSDDSENKEKAVSTLKFLQKIFSKIKQLSGGYIRLYFYSDPSKEGMLTIANRGNNVGSTTTKISVLDGYKSGIRDISLSSNLDSDMIALATNAAMSGRYSDALNRLYPGCYVEPDDGDSNDNSDDDPLQSAREGLGDRYSAEDVTSAQSALKSYFESKDPRPVLTYTLEATVKFDGYKGAEFGQAFSIDRMPARLAAAGAFFVVTKIAQDFSAGDWTTTVTGLMMVKN